MFNTTLKIIFWEELLGKKYNFYVGFKFIVPGDLAT